MNCEENYATITRLANFYVIRWLHNKYVKTSNGKSLNEMLNCSRTTIDAMFRLEVIGWSRIDYLKGLAKSLGIDKKYFTGCENRDERYGDNLYYIVKLPEEISWEKYAARRIKRVDREVKLFDIKINKVLEDCDTNEVYLNNHDDFRKLKFYIENGYKMPEYTMQNTIEETINKLQKMDQNANEYLEIDVEVLKNYENALANHLRHISSVRNFLEWQKK